MGIVGRYIDALPPEAKDRVVEAQGWTLKDDCFVDKDGCRCLCGHSEDWYLTEDGYEKAVIDYSDPRYPCNIFNGVVIFTRYPKLVQRFGLPRIVRACKLRAAKGNSLDAIVNAETSKKKEAVR